MPKRTRIIKKTDQNKAWFRKRTVTKYTEQQHLRKFYYDTLSKHWSINYIKDGKKYDFCLEIYNLLATDPNASQQEAIKRAEKLYKKQKHLVYHKQNPITLVYQLVEFLNANLRR